MSYQEEYRGLEEGRKYRGVNFEDTARASNMSNGISVPSSPFPPSSSGLSTGEKFGLGIGIPLSITALGGLAVVV